MFIATALLLLPILATGQLPDRDDNFSDQKWKDYSLNLIKGIIPDFLERRDIATQISIVIKDDRYLKSEQRKIAELNIRRSSDDMHFIISVGRKFLDKLENPEEFTAFIVHEVGHIFFHSLYPAEDKSDLQTLLRKEFGPDIIASVIVPQGACRLRDMIDENELRDNRINAIRKQILDNICRLSAISQDLSDIPEYDIKNIKIPDDRSSDREKIDYYRFLLLKFYPQYAEMIDSIKIELISDYSGIYACPERITYCGENKLYIPKNFWSSYSGKAEHVAPVLGHELGHLLFSRDYWTDISKNLDTYFLEYPGLESRMFQEMESDLFALFASKYPSCGLLVAVLAGISEARTHLNIDSEENLRKINYNRLKYLSVLCGKN